MIRVGDIIEIPLSDENKAYAQYVYKDKMGPIIQVYACIVPQKPDLTSIVQSRPLFPPIITGLSAAITNGVWKKIGSQKVEGFNYPGFVSTLYDQKTGKAGIWYFWDGENSTRLGPVLSEEYKEKEYLIVWDPHDVVHRIETGKYPFPYRDLILHNQYTPQNT